MQTELKSIIRRFSSKLQTEGILGTFRALIRKTMLRKTPIHCHPAHLALTAFTKNEGFCVIQLGAYIGNSANDPLFKYMVNCLRRKSGKLIVVEPVKCYFEELVRNYHNIPGVVCENVAISDRNGPASFYRLGVNPIEYGYPEWLSQLSSLKEDRMQSLWDGYERNNVGGDEYRRFYLKHRIEEKVDCITFSELLRRHNVTGIDLLQIDVEGSELDILRTIDFRKHPIRFINFESVLLQKNKKTAERLMRDNGYRLIDFDIDTFCYHRCDKKLFNH